MTGYTRDNLNYQHSQIVSADPIRLVALSYEGALAYIAKAKLAIEQGSIEARSTNINRACAIVADLHGALNMEKGGAIAASLDRLYSYVTRRLCDANSSNQTGPLVECQSILSTLWSAWRQIADQNASGTAETGQGNTRRMALVAEG